MALLEFGKSGTYFPPVDQNPLPHACFPKARPSVSAEASRAAELERVRKLSVEERIKEALSLERRFQGLIPRRHGSRS